MKKPIRYTEHGNHRYLIYTISDKKFISEKLSHKNLYPYIEENFPIKLKSSNYRNATLKAHLNRIGFVGFHFKGEHKGETYYSMTSVFNEGHPADIYVIDMISKHKILDENMNMLLKNFFRMKTLKELEL